MSARFVNYCNINNSLCQNFDEFRMSKQSILRVKINSYIDINTEERTHLNFGFRAFATTKRLRPRRRVSGVEGSGLC